MTEVYSVSGNVQVFFLIPQKIVNYSVRLRIYNPPMKIVFISETPMLHDRLGRIMPGQTVDVPESQAREWLRNGWAQLYETKVMQDRPSVAAGVMVLSPALPAAPASPQETLSASESGAKRRGRPRKEASLS
jgi:hypothetical protein